MAIFLPKSFALLRTDLQVIDYHRCSCGPLWISPFTKNICTCLSFILFHSICDQLVNSEQCCTDMPTCKRKPNGTCTKPSMITYTAFTSSGFVDCDELHRENTTQNVDSSEHSLKRTECTNCLSWYGREILYGLAESVGSSDKIGSFGLAGTQNYFF